MAVTVDHRELDELAERLRRLADPDAPGQLVEGLAQVWVDTARATMGYDTGQLYNRTGITHLASTARHAEAVIEADTPYAGFHNFGTRFQAPNRFFDRGQDQAEATARRLDGRIGTQLERVLESGGVWNPRALF